MHFRLAFTAAYLLASVAALPASLTQILGTREPGQVVRGAAATPEINDQDGIGRGTDAYRFYTGDGTTAAGWPAREQWVSFADMFEANRALMVQGCGNNGWGANNSDQEIQDIYNAIQQIARETAVDHRFILAVIIQESVGCVRVPTTNNGVNNPGLMQSHNGLASCFGVTPCPADTITQMIRDGTGGTPSGDGLAGLLNLVQGDLNGAGDARTFYASARRYNSGSVNYNDLNDRFTSTACYATDIANRLTGWTLASSGCPL